MQPASPALTAFWADFTAQEPALHALPLRERVEQVNALLEPHVQGLALEVHGHPEDDVVDLIATAHGGIERFPLLMQLVDAAPALQHHRVVAFRARSPQADFPIGMDGFELSTSEVLVALQPDNGQVALELRFAREIPADFADHARHMTFIMLDHVLGEYDFAVKVGAVDFVGEDEYDADVAWTPLSQLPPVFDTFWTQTLGHTGHFPQGEPQWEGLELEFNCAVDDEGNPVDDPEGDAETGGSDGGIVSVNLAANAVAMRADLPYALTLDLAVPDSDTLSAVQNLHEQAATLLQLPQLGIAALTLVRAGRRQALFYVGDEQLAKQTLAPLLLRDEAATLELKLRYDPAWTGYFEYAGYLL